MKKLSRCLLALCALAPLTPAPAEEPYDSEAALLAQLLDIPAPEKADARLTRTMKDLVHLDYLLFIDTMRGRVAANGGRLSDEDMAAVRSKEALRTKLMRERRALLSPDFACRLTLQKEILPMLERNAGAEEWLAFRDAVLARAAENPELYAGLADLLLNWKEWREAVPAEMSAPAAVRALLRSGAEAGDAASTVAYASDLLWGFCGDASPQEVLPLLSKGMQSLQASGKGGWECLMLSMAGELCRRGAAATPALAPLRTLATLLATAGESPDAAYVVYAAAAALEEAAAASPDAPPPAVLASGLLQKSDDLVAGSPWDGAALELLGRVRAKMGQGDAAYFQDLHKRSAALGFDPERDYLRPDAPFLDIPVPQAATAEEAADLDAASRAYLAGLVGKVLAGWEKVGSPALLTGCQGMLARFCPAGQESALFEASRACFEANPALAQDPGRKNHALYSLYQGLGPDHFGRQRKKSSQYLGAACAARYAPAVLQRNRLLLAMDPVPTENMLADLFDIVRRTDDAECAFLLYSLTQSHPEAFAGGTQDLPALAASSLTTALVHYHAKAWDLYVEQLQGKGADAVDLMLARAIAAVSSDPSSSAAHYTALDSALAAYAEKHPETAAYVQLLRRAIALRTPQSKK